MPPKPIQNTEQNPQTSPAIQTQKSGFGELVRFAFWVLVIVIPIRMYVVQPFVVSGESMHPTFANNQYLIVDEFSYHFKNPVRGETIIFRPPLDGKKFYIKRIIALPGETIRVQNSTVTIVNTAEPNGFVLNEPYVKVLWSGDFTHTLGPSEYFVMGDNRIASFDSRNWGALAREEIIGRPLVRLFPVREIASFPGRFEENN